MNERKSNFELLRICCIILIISFHYVWKGGFVFETFGGVSINKIIIDIFSHFGEMGVNCFILISGYFLSDTKFHWKKVILLSLQTEFYIVINRIILVYAKESTISNWSWKDYLFPILIPHYWFITVYVLIYILTPYLYKLIESLNKKEFETLIIIQLIIWSVFPTLILGTIYHSNDTESMRYYNRYIWLIIVYIIGAYIRKYEIPFLNGLKNSIIWFLTTFIILIFYIIGTEYHIFPWEKSEIFFWTPNSILQISISICLFMIFRYLSLPPVKIINYIASCSLGIYMLHDGVANTFLWTKFFQNSSYQYSRYLILHIAFAVILIIIAGIIIESIRKLIEYFIIL